MSHAEHCWSYTISETETVQSSISSEKSTEIASLLQMAEDCCRCAQWRLERSGRQWSCATLIGRSLLRWWTSAAR